MLPYNKIMSIFSGILAKFNVADGTNDWPFWKSTERAPIDGSSYPNDPR